VPSFNIGAFTVNDFILRRLREARLSLLFGPPILLLASLYLLYGNVRERQQREDVINHGEEAQASIKRLPGRPGAVIIEWTARDYGLRTAEAWAGKSFLRDARPGQLVTIKYIQNSAVEPVIVSELTTRERENRWLIRTSAGVAIAMVLACVFIGRCILAGRKSSKGMV
jgi:hypothetical protein